eukprot:gene7983-9378_t
MTIDPEKEEAQNEEMMCLQSIYRDDFEILPSEGVCKRFMITLIPHPTNQYQNYCSVRLNVKYTPNYPDTLPNIELEKVKGLSDDQIEELDILLSQKMVAGEVVVFELCQAVQEFLLIYNKETVSLHEEMIQRLKELNNSGSLRAMAAGNNNNEEEEDFDHQSATEEDYDLDNNYTDGSGLSPLHSFDTFFGAGGGGDSIFEENLASLKGSTSIEFEGDHNHHTTELEPPPRIKWKLGSCLARFDLTSTHEATNLETGQLMVCKIIAIDPDSSDASVRLARLYTIQREVECMKYLINPQLVRYVGTSIEGPALHIFQEHIRAETMRSRIIKLGRIDEAVVRKYTYQLLLALLYLHSQHIPHRDVASKNIFVDDDANRVLFSNYGGKSTRIFDAMDRAPSKNLNVWIAQQQAAAACSKYMLRRDDFLGLGLVVLEMLTGHIITRPSSPPPVDYLRLFEATSLHETTSPLAKSFLEQIFRSDVNDRTKLEAGLLLKHPFISSHHSLSTSNPTLPKVTAKDPAAAPPLRNTTSSISTTTTASTTSESLTPPSSPCSPRASTQTPVRGNMLDAGSPVVKPARSTPLQDFRYHSSRYRTDFEEIEMIGRGGFGVVVKARNKLDGRYYAIKKIKTDGYSEDDAEPLTNKLLREVTTLSRLHHQYVVRYYQAWIERTDPQMPALFDDMEELSGGLETDASEDWFMQSSLNSRSMIDRSTTSFSDDGDLSYSVNASNDLEDYNNEDEDETFGYTPAKSRILSSNLTGTGTGGGHSSKRKAPAKDTHMLYIQMEYCSKKTLKTLIDNIGGLSEEEIWRLFRQTVEGLAHIHSQGIIHRDLKV